MRTLVATNDPVLLSFVEALLRDQAIEFVVSDRYISIVEGSIGAFPRRLQVSPQSWDEARTLLKDAGLGAWISDDDGV
jgi:hypothetical protein